MIPGELVDFLSLEMILGLSEGLSDLSAMSSGFLVETTEMLIWFVGRSVVGTVDCVDVSGSVRVRVDQSVIGLYWRSQDKPNTTCIDGSSLVISIESMCSWPLAKIRGVSRHFVIFPLEENVPSKRVRLSGMARREVMWSEAKFVSIKTFEAPESTRAVTGKGEIKGKMTLSVKCSSEVEVSEELKE